MLEESPTTGTCQEQKRPGRAAHILLEEIAGTCQEQKPSGRNPLHSRASLAEYHLVLGLFGLIRPWPENDSKRSKTVQVWGRNNRREHFVLTKNQTKNKSNHQQKTTTKMKLYSSVLPTAAFFATVLQTSTAQQLCVETDTPFNAGFGECSTYAEGLGNNSFCDQDVDSNGILAQDACAECGVCVEAAVCIVGETPFNAGFGECSTYAEGLGNNSFCDQDVDSNGVVAQDACAECGLCVEPEQSLETCVETDTPFNAGFGDCSTYAEGLGNNSFCDQDVDSNGILAQDACAECGVCVEAAVCIVGETPFNAGFGDCSTYAEGLGNNSFCDQDVDSNGVVAEDACAECGLCVEPEPSLETCVETEAPFDAGFGDCSTYAEGLGNNSFCSLDVDSNGVVAEDACAECGVCVAAPACVDTGVPFDAGFGDCSTYAEGLTNNFFCSTDVDSNGVVAEDACAECGQCV